MKAEWNAGYEKGRDDYCCNHNCNQGRDCPLRKAKPVAWRKVVGNVTKHYQYNEIGEGTPLYTHPVKEQDEPNWKEMYWEMHELNHKHWSELKAHPVKEQGNPVAWRSQDPDGYWSVYQAPVEGAEPLYTGIKELTDEEIYDAYEEYCKTDVSEKGCLQDFARAILRKAQEK